MDKFGLFNLISKLQNGNNADALQNLLSSFLSSNVKSKQPIKNEKSENSKIIESPPEYRYDAILNLIKRHDSISKQIDKDNNS